jgi:DNA polymerase
VHGQEQEVTLASTTVLLYPLYHPAAALYTPSMLKALEDDFARLPGLLGHATVTPVARAPLAVASEVPRRPTEDSDSADAERALVGAVQLGLF